MSVIYMATNNITNECYIGKTTKSLNIRKNKHLYDARRQTYSTHFHNALRKYGKEAFDWIVLESVLDVDINNAECFWITYFKSIGILLYNLTPGGDGLPKGYRVSEQTKEKHRRYKHSEKHKNKIRNAVMGRKYKPESIALSANKRKKTIILRNPQGELMEIHGIKEFCFKYSYNFSSISNLIHGRYKSSYGWTLP